MFAVFDLYISCTSMVRMSACERTNVPYILILPFWSWFSPISIIAWTPRCTSMVVVVVAAVVIHVLMMLLVAGWLYRSTTDYAAAALRSMEVAILMILILIMTAPTFVVCSFVVFTTVIETVQSCRMGMYADVHINGITGKRVLTHVLVCARTLTLVCVRIFVGYGVHTCAECVA